MGHNTKQSLCSLCGKRRSSRAQYVQDVQVCSRKTCAKTQRLLERALKNSTSPVITVHHYYHGSYENNAIRYSYDLHAKAAPNIEALTELPDNIVRPRPEANRS